MSDRLAELRQWAAREAVEDKPLADKHFYSADCPWCGQASHELALLLLDVVDAVAAAFKVSHVHDEDDDETQEAWRAAWLAYRAFEDAS